VHPCASDSYNARSGGIAQLSSRWVSHPGACTRTGPRPTTAYAIREPSVNLVMATRCSTALFCRGAGLGPRAQGELWASESAVVATADGRGIPVTVIGRLLIWE
jgi:hypothetical protein